jgi:hypothetical protein
MMFLLFGFIASLIGMLPLLINKSLKDGLPAYIIALVIGTLFGWLVFYNGMPSLALPLWGGAGVLTLIYLIVTAVIAGMMQESFPGGGYVAIVGILIFVIRGCSGCALIKANDYANMIGKVDTREWTQDVQPKDPAHVRMVPDSLAMWLANKQLGEVPGAIGSQFSVDFDHMTLQLIKGELWYVAPLDFNGYAVWSSTHASPGFVMVHGEDPMRPVIVKTNHKLVYTDKAWFGSQMERHLWLAGYYTSALTDFSFEVDENGKPWWVVSKYEPTLAWSGEKILGVVLLDPETGATTEYPLGSIPNWIDRAVPPSFVENYVSWKGEYSLGWWNSFWDKKNITRPEKPLLNYGANGDPQWVTCVTSSNNKDQSMVGLYYTDARTGESVFYHSVGGTEASVVTAVNNAVSYKKWHGTDPVLYNIYGVMTAIVPLLGEHHTYQGVAFVRVDNLEVAHGENQFTAMREYQKLLSRNGQQITPENIREAENVVSEVLRIAQEVRGGETVYYLQVKKDSIIYTGSSELSAKLPLTRIGDPVVITYVHGEQTVVPMMKFDNLAIHVQISPEQLAVQNRVEARQEQVTTGSEVKTARDNLNKMSDEELIKMMKDKKTKK